MNETTTWRKEGTIVRWDDAKGFGFIRSAGMAQDVFVHVRDFRGNSGEAPRQGLRVTFDDVHVGGKGPRAVAVRPAHSGPVPAPRTQGATRSSPARPPAARRPQPPYRASPPPRSGAAVALPLMLAYGVALAWSAWRGVLPWWVLPASFALNLVTFFAYWQDKYAAQKRHWRIAEDTLHFWSLAGGWGGAWVAQQVLRHKSKKASFRATYWGTVVLHCGALAAWLWHVGVA